MRAGAGRRRNVHGVGDPPRPAPVTDLLLRPRPQTPRRQPPPRTVIDAGAGRDYQLRHWSAGTISASTSDAFSRSTFPPTT